MEGADGLLLLRLAGGGGGGGGACDGAIGVLEDENGLLSDLGHWGRHFSSLKGYQG